MKLPRFLHCIYAFCFGYFWLPCSICGRYFGGHERSVTWMHNLGMGESVCEKHEDLARKHNEELYKNLPPIRIKL